MKNGDKFKLFDVAAFGPRNFFQKTITFFSGRYCHIGFLVSGIFLQRVLKQFGKKDESVRKDYWYVLSASIKYNGVFYEEFNKISKKYNYIDIYRHEFLYNNYNKFLLMYGYIIGSLGKKYSLFQLIKIFFKLCFNFIVYTSLKKKVEAFICSEYVGYGLNLIEPCDEDFEFSTPDSIITCFSLKFIICYKNEN